jgi:hypothetical protein
MCSRKIEGTVNKPSRLDPNTATVGFYYGLIGPDWNGACGRIYYWYDPNQEQSGVESAEFMAQHPEIPDEDWLALFREAFDRGEREFLKQWLEEEPDLFSDPEKSRGAWLGYTFGPCGPSPETFEAVGLADQEPKAGG